MREQDLRRRKFCGNELRAGTRQSCRFIYSTVDVSAPAKVAL